MRLSSVEIHNFRGLRRFELDSLEDEPLVLLSGANGAGKSLALEAILIASNAPRTGWMARPEQSIGPWGSALRIDLRFVLTADEKETLQGLADELEDPMVAELGTCPDEIGNTVEATRQTSRLETDPWLRLLFNAREEFANVDYLGPDRIIPRGEPAQVAMGVLSDQQRQDLRDQSLRSAFDKRAPVALAGIQSVLATLDYLDLLALREGHEQSREFALLTEAFERATGKAIPRPRTDPASATGTRLEVETPAGVRHDIDQLSSGEQAVLGLMFYVRRVSAGGGILLIDEPELHLHPALQPALMSVLDDVAERAQLWIATHSTGIVTASASSALVHVRPPTSEDRNQAVQAAEDADRIALLDDLGIDAAAALQAELILVVEGDDDKKRLQQMLPIETGRATFVVAGNGDAVVRTSRALAGGYEGAWVAVRDRDLLSEQDVAGLGAADPHLFVWPGRMLENELLHPPLVARALTAAGRPTAVGEIEELLQGRFDAHRPQILAGRVEAMLQSEADHEPIEGRSSIKQLTAYLEAVKSTAEAKLTALTDTERRVDAELESLDEPSRAKLIDGKRALKELRHQTPFSRPDELADALLHHLRGAPDVVPPGVAALRQRLRVAAASTSLKT